MAKQSEKTVTHANQIASVEVGREDRRSLLRLSLAEREEIHAGVERGESLRSIARLLNRNVSAISHEVDRNGGRETYRAWRADERAAQAALQARYLKVEAKNAGRRSRSRSTCAALIRMTRGMQASHETLGKGGT